MKCDSCEQEATVHEVVRRGGKTVERHLCEQCAKKHGIAVQHMPINELIQKYVLQQQQGGGAASPPPASAKTCPTCALTYAEFRQSGLLGCPGCYATFSSALEPLLERAHEGGARHVGKVPKRLAQGAPAPGRRATQRAQSIPGPADQTERLKVLARQLEEAVRAEQYERAAALRDEIRRVAEPQGTSPGARGSAPGSPGEPA